MLLMGPGRTGTKSREAEQDEAVGRAEGAASCSASRDFVPVRLGLIGGGEAEGGGVIGACL